MFFKTCQKPLPDETISATASVQPAEAVAARKCNKKVIVTATIAAVVAITFFLVWSFGTKKNYNSPEAVAKAYALAEYTYDAEKMVDCVPDFFLKETFGDISRKEMIASMNSQVVLDRYLSCKILGAVRSDDTQKAHDFKEQVVLREYKDSANFSVISSIDDYCLVTVEASVDDNIVKQTVFCINYNNNWYVLPAAG